MALDVRQGMEISPAVLEGSILEKNNKVQELMLEHFIIGHAEFRCCFVPVTHQIGVGHENLGKILPRAFILKTNHTGEFFELDMDLVDPTI
jgi:hypothetical protein